MNLSIDTNIIYGIINHKDRISHESKNLMKDKQSHKLFICHSAICESITALRHKINEIVIDIINGIKGAYKSSLNNIELQNLISTEIKKLESVKPILKNFLKWVDDEIRNFLDTQNKDDLISYLSKLSLNLSNSIRLKLSRIRPDYSEIKLDIGMLEKVQKSIAGIYFKDYDERIFLELMTNLQKISPIEFYSDDDRYVKKCNKGYIKLANDLNLKKDSFIAIDLI